jgi:uroporphyrin-III C-methyltransferase
MPLTQRGLSQAVTFVTATGAGGDTLNWSALAQADHTVVFYMSAAQTGHVTAQLLAHGLPGTQPVALIERATWPEERVLKGTLAELPAMAAGAQLRSPTLLVVGQVAALAQIKQAMADAVADDKKTAD